MQALIVEEPSSEPKESNPANLVALKTQTTALRDQIYRLEKEEEFKSGGGGGAGGRRASGKSLSGDGGGGGGGGGVRHSKATEKPRKKLAEVEAQLLLASPGLVFQVRREMSEIKGGRRKKRGGKAKKEKSFVCSHHERKVKGFSDIAPVGNAKRLTRKAPSLNLIRIVCLLYNVALRAQCGENGPCSLTSSSSSPSHPVCLSCTPRNS